MENVSRVAAHEGLTGVEVAHVIIRVAVLFIVAGGWFQCASAMFGVPALVDICACLL